MRNADTLYTGSSRGVNLCLMTLWIVSEFETAMRVALGSPRYLRETDDQQLSP
jgi:hypothetical protein